MLGPYSIYVNAIQVIHDQEKNNSACMYCMIGMFGSFIATVRGKQIPLEALRLVVSVLLLYIIFVR